MPAPHVARRADGTTVVNSWTDGTTFDPQDVLRKERQMSWDDFCRIGRLDYVVTQLINLGLDDQADYYWDEWKDDPMYCR